MPGQRNEPVRFKLHGVAYVLAPAWQIAAGKRVVPSDQTQALSVLEPLLADPIALAAAGGLLQGGAGQEHVADPHALLVAVAERVTSGQLALCRADPGPSARLAALTQRFNDRLEGQMRLTARDLLDPSVERIEGHPLLKKIPPERVLEALQDLLMDLPLSDTDIGRELCEVLAHTPLGAGRDLTALSPRELSDQLQHQAKSWLKRKLEDTRSDRPVLFWGMAAAALIAAGLLTYQQGTGLMEQLGVKPELKATLLGGKLSLAGRASFGPQLADPQLSAEARAKLANGALELGGRTEWSGPDFGHLSPDEHHFDATIHRGSAQLRGDLDLEGNGSVRGYGLSGSRSFDAVGGFDKLTLQGGYQRNLLTNSERITGGLRGTADGLDLSLRGSHDLSSHASSIGADIGKDIGGGRLSGFVEQQFGGPGGSDTRAGILFTIRF